MQKRRTIIILILFSLILSFVGYNFYLGKKHTRIAIENSSQIITQIDQGNISFIPNYADRDSSFRTEISNLLKQDCSLVFEKSKWIGKEIITPPYNPNQPEYSQIYVYYEKDFQCTRKIIAFQFHLTTYMQFPSAIKLLDYSEKEKVEQLLWKPLPI